MNPDEIIDLLLLCAFYDYRNTSEGEVLAWHAALNDLPLADAKTAVVEYYKRNRERITVADIRERVQAIQADRMARLDDRGLMDDVNPDDPAWTVTFRARRALLANGGTVAEAQTAYPARLALSWRPS